MRIAIVTDAWDPQINGVVRTLHAITRELRTMGHEPHVIGPHRFASMPCPTYPEIRLALATPGRLGRELRARAPDAIHIATEGPLGFAARQWCNRHRLPFTTAYHTQFPQYLAERTRLPAGLFWRYIRWFHAPSRAVLASTRRVRMELRSHGIWRVRHWSRGVDLDRFGPDSPRHPQMDSLTGPILLYVGRIAIEKNIDAFLACSHPGTKVVVGDGPALAQLKRRYPEALFLGALHGTELASAYATADAFVFPSKSDTFGLVMIEALASGTPVAAFPVAGPLDVLTEAVACLDENLDHAIAGALLRDRAPCVDHARSFDWRQSAEQFVAALVPLGGPGQPATAGTPAVA